MSKRNTVEEKVYQALRDRLQDRGFVLVDVVYRRENGKLFLRLLVDKPGGISIDECATINEQFDPVIEEELGLKDHDFFEVSSPGLERPLTTSQDFELYRGELVEVKLYQKHEGKKLFSGELCGGDEAGLRIKDEHTGQDLVFDLKDVAKVVRAIRVN